MAENTGPVEVEQPVTQMGATFAERKAAREAAEKRRGRKQVSDDGAENKAVKPAETKRTAKKAAKKA